MTHPILVGSANAAPGFASAIEILRAGAPALDAVEAAARAVEADESDTTVGRGGIPNLLGEVELDAMIMDGATLAAGAVAGLRGFPHPISVARRVMEELPHLFLVGDGAARFAAEMGFEPGELATEHALEIWRERLEADEASRDDPDEPLAARARRLARDAEIAAEIHNRGQSVTGTVNFLARDAAGEIAVAVSTSGWAWKYPGRVGDSPIVGAGGYADSRYGAAACTGRGEMAVRAATARSVVLYMKMGLPLWNACREAMRDIVTLDDPYASGLHLIALDATGRHSGFSTRPNRHYLFQRTDMDAPERRSRHFVDENGEIELRPTTP